MVSCFSMRRMSLLLTLLMLPAAAQSLDPSLYAGLEWRMIGPFRGGRTVGAAGIPGQPNVFYIGVNNGGVWKTDDYGRTWRPIFDDQPTGSIGCIAVAPSDPKIIYVGSGEGLQRPDLSIGDGMYKSTDGGKTLAAPRPARRTADRLHPGGPARPQPHLRRGAGPPVRPERRARRLPLDRRRRDAGRRSSTRTSARARWTWRSIRAIRARFTPCCGRRSRGRGRTAQFSGPNSGLFKSTDGGDTWTPLTGGLPTFAQGLGRIGIGDCAGRSQPHVRAGGGRPRPRRAVPLRRCRRNLAPRESRAARLRPRQRLRRRARGPEESRRRLRRQHLALPVHGRRHDLHRVQRRARRRRLPHHLDQPRRIPTSSCWRSTRAPPSP